MTPVSSRCLGLLLVLVLALAGCANPVLHDADELARANQLPQALAMLETALQQAPTDATLRAAELRIRERLVARLLMQIESLRAAGRWADARAAAQRLREIDAQHARLSWFDAEIERGQRQEVKLLEARQQLREGRSTRAETLAHDIIAETPTHPGARLLLSQIARARPLEAPGGELGAAFQKPVTLEFREAPLRQVFEALARSSGVNFVFDKDVRADTKVTVFLRQVSLDEAMRVILSTQQLDRKLLNESSVLIFPNTSAKQREHQELITRTLYLANADVKQVQAMVRTIAKVRDIHIDERLNLMVVRDTPEVMRLVEKLIASVDLPEPEVMLELEVMELTTDRDASLGLEWPTEVQYGQIDVSGQIDLSKHKSFRLSVANPAVVANLSGTTENVNLLANPKIRVRNRERAKVHIGEKLPVFTTTSTASDTVSTSVTYLDIGLKLDVEPTIQLDNDVNIKISLEVTNLIGKVTGPSDSVAYNVGTRTTSTVLRLADGETQILAGLINDEDRRSSNGIPGLQDMPVLGRLFGVQNDTRNKTELVLLITPRIVRNLALPDAGLTRQPGGTDAQPGAYSNRIRSEARAGVALSSGGAARPGAVAPVGAGASAAAQAADSEVALKLDVTPQVAVGGTVSVTLRHDSGVTVKAEIEFDPSKLQPAQAGAGTASSGRLPFELTPRGERVLMLRTLPAAAGQIVNIGVGALSADGLNGEAPPVRLDGSGMVAVEGAR